MATTVTIDSVTTEDAVPTTAPHKISSVTGKTTATVAFTPSSADASPINAWRVMLGGVSRGTGTKLASKGLVCGMDVCGPNSLSLSIPSGTQQSDVISYSQVSGDADGDYTVNVYALTGQGWNT